MTPLAPRARWSLRLVVGAHLALVIGLFVVLQVVGPNPRSRADTMFVTLIAMILALTESQGLLLTSSWALGRAGFGRRTLRTALLAATLMGLYLIGLMSLDQFGLRDGGAKAFAAAMFVWTPVLLGGLPLWIARRYRWRWLDETTPPNEPVQFSIAQALLTTVLLAGLFAAARFAYTEADAAALYLKQLYADPASRYFGEALGFVLAMSAFLASGWLGAAACSGSQPRASLVVAALVSGYLLGQGARVMVGNRESPEFSYMLGFGAPVTGALTIVSLLALRVGGLRIDREPLPGSAHSAAATAAEVVSPATPDHPLGPAPLA